MKYGCVEISPKSWEVIVKNIIETTLEDNMQSDKVIGHFDLEGLSKIENVGKYASEKAMKFISDMTGYSAELKVFNIRLITPKEIKDEYGEDKKVFTKIDFTGDINGTGVLIFSEDSAVKLSKAMLSGMGMESDTDEMDDMKISAINEICNILISAYVDSFANFMNTSLTMSPPTFIVGSGKELLEKIFNENKIDDDDIIMAFRSTLHICEVGTGFDVLIVLPHESVKILFDAISKGEVQDKLSVKYEN
ncbi:MAG: chemotaxis protein CheX [Methanococci archaeon]|uniref:CheC, inhibitor of MCP methylation n=1 Tax=Methanocaldococcus vulcanius (strain ATCC 700851 / DSM 12094 / M7) TaxID=579137 RepID=C9RIE9_METVM|nr:chemotaxis protein CheC [Methanocaldococcus vulcanius]ACX73351.1 CheC, inhibitor of MCP methylation [Methanocaldococcus vulcanius M7]NPA63223.1 chemotaxis protein CheX [Methanococci archaeon]